MTIGDNIRKLRESRELTLDDVAKVCKTGRQTIYKYEKGIIKNIPSDKIEAMAKLFRVSPIELMGWSESPLETLVNQIKEEETMLDRLMVVASTCSDEQIAKAIEYLQFLKDKYGE